jgi:hypothetical protein
MYSPPWDLKTIIKCIRGYENSPEVMIQQCYEIGILGIIEILEHLEYLAITRREH